MKQASQKLTEVMRSAGGRGFSLHARGGEINAIVLYRLTHLNDLVNHMHNSCDKCDFKSSAKVVFSVQVSLLAPPSGSRKVPRLYAH